MQHLSSVAMNACRECRSDLPLKVRFCPFCGTADPVDRANPADSASQTELDRSRGSSDPASVVQATAPAAAEAPASRSGPDGGGADRSPSSIALPRGVRVASGTGPVAPAETPPLPDPIPVRFGRRLALAAAALAVAVWIARPLLGSSDPCQSSDVSLLLDHARAALGARDHSNALSKSTLALATCAQGQRADELKRIQTEAVTLSVAAGRRCLKAMDVACLEQVRAELELVTEHPTAKAFNADFERDIGRRTSRDLEEAMRCLAVGDIECADRRMKVPLALRRSDTSVQTLNEQVDKARAAADAAKSCMATTATDCAAEPLDALRQVSPRSPLIKGLERHVQLAKLQQEQPPGEGSTQVAPTQAATAPMTAPQSAVPSAPITATAPPDIRIGDRWVLQTTDHNNPQWSNSTERVVTEVSNTGMTMTSRNIRSNYKRQLSFTREWNLISEREPNGKSAAYSPPMQYLMFPLEKGKTWRTEVRKQRSDGGVEQIYSLAGEVQGAERVQVRAGTFDAIKVVLQVEIRENGTLLSQATDVSWYAPIVKRSVKTEENSQDLVRGERFTRTVELVEYSVTR